MPTWILFRAYEKGYVSIGYVCKEQICERGICVNLPELEVVRPGLFRMLSASLNEVNYEEIKINRLKPDFGDKMTEFISKDNQNDLAVLFSNPAEQPEIKRKGLKISIEWNAMNCFTFLLLNGANRKGAMILAVQLGRVEMIERLEQDGQDFYGCVVIAAKYFQNEILKWLLDENKEPRHSTSLCTALNCRNVEAAEMLLGTEEITWEVASAAAGVWDDRVIEWIQKNTVPNTDVFQIEMADFFSKGSLELCKALPKPYSSIAIFFSMTRVPFNEEIAQLALDGYQCSQPKILLKALTKESSLFAINHNITIITSLISNPFQHTLADCDVIRILVENDRLKLNEPATNWWQFALASVEQLQLVVELGCNLLAADEKGNTFYHHLAQNLQYFEILDALLTISKAGLQVQNKEGKLPIDLADCSLIREAMK